jgi:hypothetical protein
MLEKIIGFVQKENENIKPGIVELEIGVKNSNVQMYCVWCLFTRVNVSRVITHLTSTRTFCLSIFSSKFQLGSE